MTTTSPLEPIRNWLRSDMRVLRWVFLALYVTLILGLAGLAVVQDSGALWIIAGVTVAAQALFIFGAGTIHLCRPIKKRRLWMPVVIAIAMMTLLVLGMVAALNELVFGKGGWVNLYMELNNDEATQIFWCFFAFNWIVWGVLLWRFAQKRNRKSVIGGLTTIIFSGSLVELLAAVPSHMIVSRRPGCLVGLATMTGIVAGIYVMLFSFGPAIALLFLRPRYRREEMELQENPICRRCEYELRGTIEAGRTECPECGEKIAGISN